MNWRPNEKSMQLILRFEVGGGEPYYNKQCLHPIWPGGASGVTIGVGYDLGYNAPETIRKDWEQHVENQIIDRLVECSKKTENRAKEAVSGVRDITIPWGAAYLVYVNVTIPRFWENTYKAFPGVESVHPNCQGALLSLVFNRGMSLKGPTREEMRNIKNLVPNKDYPAIAEQIRSMKRLWRGKSIEKGMSRRRDAEADLVLSSVG